MELRRFEGHSHAVTACAYSPDGQRIISASMDEIVLEWASDSGKELRRFEGHSQAVCACAYSPDGQVVLSASLDDTIRFWSADDGRLLDTIYGASAFECIACIRGHIAAGDALGNVWMLEHDWF